MDPLYQRTFDQVRMSEEGTGRVRDELASRCAQKKMEEITMRSDEKTRRPLAAIAAVCAVLALTVTAFASSGLAEQVFHMLSGGTITVGTDENGAGYTEFRTEGLPASPVETREDGRLYFIANGEDIDITDLCSNETPYVHECEDADGQRHLFIVGGEDNAIGWAECVAEDDGGMSAFVVSLPPEAEDQPTPWLDEAMAQLGARLQID